ncbi:TPA: IS66 family insertion sequence element accessory protein TnpB, partial [Escherichia coli]|nr:IS66 family insertion sequence element accessory protein TnpB [Escherichia coli]
GSSFVCRLSRLLPEVYVKGYINEVFSKMSPQATGYALDKFGPAQTAVLLQRLFPDGPPPLDKFDKDFCSVTYKNGILIKRTDSKRK